MKKFLPVIILLVGVIMVVGAFLFLRHKKDQAPVEPVDEESNLVEVPLEKRPVVSLTPTLDGHYLNLKIEKINIDGAETLDYELIYKVPNGVTQGVPGSVNVKGKESFEADLLLGSESSGKFRYDEGVEEGTLTLRFRNEKGKLVAKFSTDFRMVSKIADVVSSDSEFTYKFDKTFKQGFFVVMQTFGLPEKINRGGNIESGPYGVFSLLSKDLDGTVGFNQGVNYFRFDGKNWVDVRNTSSKGIGIFVALSE